MSRTSTPSLRRHLLTERAALKGELQQMSALEAELRAKLQKARDSQRRLEARLADLDAKRQHQVAAVAAFKLVLQAEWPRLEATGLKPVKGWAGKYGARGAFKAFILEQLQAAAPLPLTSQALVLSVIQRFDCDSTTPTEARRLRDYVTEVLHQAAARGVLHLVGKHRHTLWRWGPRDELRALLRAAEASREHEDPDPVRSEVGGQRAGGSHG